MQRTLNALRRLALLPFVQGPEEILVGGQAVIEGVMMRSPHSWAVAVRKSSGSMAVMQAHLDRPSERRPWLRYPLLRGLGVLGQAMVLGIRALRYSAQEAYEDIGAGDAQAGAATNKKKKSELSDWFLALNVIFSLVFFILFYKFLPLYAATFLQHHYRMLHNFVAFNLV
ncbi:MAG: DUF1385 domain-containing protein, partial [Terriglobia bacterium]